MNFSDDVEVAGAMFFYVIAVSLIIWRVQTGMIWRVQTRIMPVRATLTWAAVLVATAIASAVVLPLWTWHMLKSAWRHRMRDVPMQGWERRLIDWLTGAGHARERAESVPAAKARNGKKPGGRRRVA